MNDKVVPITRLNKFYSKSDFDLEIQMGREYLEGDGNFTIILYKVDITSTESDDVYHEGTKDGIKFYPPIELKVLPILNEPINSSYGNTGGQRNLTDGNLIFSIYNEQLVELGVDVDFGDYIGMPVTETEMRYFTVVNDGKKNYDNRHTIMGYKTAFRTITCSQVDKNEFSSI